MAVFCTFAVSARSRLTQNALDSLDCAITNSQAILKKRNDIIKQSKSELYDSNNARTGSRLVKIANAYSGLNNDSAIVYYKEALSTPEFQANTAERNIVSLKMATHLARATMFEEAIDMLNSCCINELPDSIKIQYFRALATVHTYCEQYHRLPYKKEQGRRDALNALDSLLHYLPENSTDAMLSRSLKSILENNVDFARCELIELLERPGLPNSGLSDIYTLLARIEQYDSDRYDEYIYYLAKAATTNILDGNCDSPTLAELGVAMFKNGDRDRAYTYLTTSSQRIFKSGAAAQYFALIPAMSTLVESMNHYERKRSYSTTVIIITLLTLLIISLFMLFKRKKYFNILTNKHSYLNSSLLSRDAYIERLLNLCSVYGESIEDINRLVTRKLKAKQFVELLEICESGKIVKEHSERFFEIFDKSVLEMYPDFIEKVNKLMLPDRGYSASSSTQLGPELRIIAFYRMGFSDSQKLAKFLGLSLNTVYTYKNRIKNKLVDKDNFEENIRNIL